MDAVARLILDEAGPLTGPVVVLDDLDAALTRACLERGLPVRAWCDDLRDATALPEGVRLGSLDDLADAVAAARASRVAAGGSGGAGSETEPAEVVILWRLPRALAALEDVAERLAEITGVRIVAGGRVKHMTRGQNDVLARSFASVRASLGRDKCRVLHASDPRPHGRRWPRSGSAGGLTVWAHGAVFNIHRLDAGTALLLSALDGLREPSAGAWAHDLGSGSGILATTLARRGWHVSASDVSAAAVESTRLTAEANGVEVDVRWADGLGHLDDRSLDLLVTNPPFHVGAAKDSTPTLDALADAGRVLRPGGELWCVFNSHLPYRRVLEDHVGPTRVVARDQAYTVVRAVRQDERHHSSGR